MAERLRKESAVHEFELVPEVEFRSPSAAAESNPDQSGRDTFAKLQLLWDHRRWLARVAAWAIAVSTVVAFLIPNIYESTVRIMPPDSMNSTGTMLASLAGKTSPELAAMAGKFLGMKDSGALYVDLFRSRTVEDKVVDRLSLQKVYWKRYKQDARKKLDGRTDVSEDRKSGVILLTVEDRDRQRARDIALAYVDELNHLMAQVSTSSARRERIFIEQRLIDCKRDLEDAERQFSAFASKNTALDIKEQTKAMVESAAALQGQLIAAQSELQSLEQIYTDNNVRVRSMRARVDELKRQTQNIHGTDSSLASDAGAPDELYPSVRKLPLLGVEWADLFRRTKIQETVFELLTQQYELARIQEAKEIPTINVIDPANIPEKKSWPPRLLIVVVLTILSLAGAVVKISGSRKLQTMEPDDPRRQMAMRAAEGFSQLRSRIAHFKSRNGSRPPERSATDSDSW
jgi:uncharacterized protein involved in exopolysaccharide biosynthesis